MIAEIFFVLMFVINVVAFVLYAYDKHKAVYELWRTPEALLITVAACGGAYGAGMAMLLFRHKTKHLLFTITVPVCFIIWMAIWIFMVLSL